MSALDTDLLGGDEALGQLWNSLFSLTFTTDSKCGEKKSMMAFVMCIARQNNQTKSGLRASFLIFGFVEYTPVREKMANFSPYDKNLEPKPKLSVQITTSALQ